MNPDPLIGLAIEEAPAIIAFVKGLFAAKNPTAPLPTDADVMAALLAATASSITKDEAWLAAHPA